MDMMMAYYVTVGSAVHTVMQNYLSRSGKFLADYYCKRCGTYYPLSHVHSCCGHPTEYEEVQISFLRIGGHIDGIFQDSQGHYWILDFKTTSMKSAPEKQKKPGDAYSEQVESYAYLLYRQYGIRVKGAILCFLPRDNPRTPVLWVKELGKVHFREIHERLKRYRKIHAQAMEASTVEEVMEFYKHRCSNQYCEYCKLSKRELKASVVKALKSKHKLPLSNLNDLLKNQPEGMISVSRRSPVPHVSFQVPVPKLKMSPEELQKLSRSIRVTLKKINQLTDKLES